MTVPVPPVTGTAGPVSTLGFLPVAAAGPPVLTPITPATELQGLETRYLELEIGNSEFGSGTGMWKVVFIFLVWVDMSQLSGVWLLLL